MYKEIVGRGIVSPTYFFYSMTFTEASQLMSAIYEQEKAEWEKIRMQMYVVAQGNSTEEITPQDVIKFPWEEETTEVEDEQAELRRLNEEAKKMTLQKH